MVGRTASRLRGSHVSTRNVSTSIGSPTRGAVSLDSASIAKRAVRRRAVGTGWMPATAFLLCEWIVAVVGDDVEAVTALHDVGHRAVIDHYGDNPKMRAQAQLVMPSRHPDARSRSPYPGPMLPETDVARSAGGSTPQYRLPDRARGQIRYELDVADRHLTVLECRPPWRAEYGPDWTRFPIVRFHYAKARREWSTYWRDRNLRFHGSI